MHTNSVFNAQLFFEFRTTLAHFQKNECAHSFTPTLFSAHFFVKFPMVGSHFEIGKNTPIFTILSHKCTCILKSAGITIKVQQNLSTICNAPFTIASIHSSRLSYTTTVQKPKWFWLLFSQKYLLSYYLSHTYIYSLYTNYFNDQYTIPRRHFDKMILISK